MRSVGTKEQSALVFDQADPSGRARGNARTGSTNPASSSCIRIMLVNEATDGRPVSMTKARYRRYKGSRFEAELA